MAGSVKYRKQLGSRVAEIDPRVDAITRAIRVAEGNPNYGVLSVKTNDPQKVVKNSIVNNYARWIAAGRPGKFIDFMQQRWAPIGAENDPNNLNANWSGNVRRALLQQLGAQQYQQLQKQNLVLSGGLQNGYA